MLPIVINILLAIHVLVSLLIVLLVLMQRPKNEGLGAAFGGGMTENLFGAQTSNVLQTITRWLGVIFFVLALTLSYLYVKNTRKSSIQQRLATKGAAVTSITPAAASGDKVSDAATKAAEEKQKGETPADGASTVPGAASAPVKPGEPLPAPAAPAALAPAAPAAPDAKPDAPAPASEKPATPEKAPEKPADDAPAK